MICTVASRSVTLPPVWLWSNPVDQSHSSTPHPSPPRFSRTIVWFLLSQRYLSWITSFQLPLLKVIFEFFSVPHLFLCPPLPVHSPSLFQSSLHHRHHHHHHYYLISHFTAHLHWQVSLCSSYSLPSTSGTAGSWPLTGTKTGAFK